MSKKRPFNVDIYWDCAQSTVVMAESKEESMAIVDELITKGEICYSTEVGGWELNADYQPDEFENMTAEEYEAQVP